MLPTSSWPGYTYYPVTGYNPDVACVCVKQWLGVFRPLCVKKGFGDPVIWQCTGGDPASGGVHSRGGAIDLADIGDKRAMLAREMGAVAWPRPWFKPDGTRNFHTHMVLDCPHNGPAAYQRVACIVYRRDGTGADGRLFPDPLPPPSRWRTWQEGIAWGKAQLVTTTTPKEFPVDATTRAYYWNQTVSRAGEQVSIIQEIADAKTLGMKNAEKLDYVQGQLRSVAALVAGVDEATVDTPVNRAGTQVPLIQEIADTKTAVLALEKQVADLTAFIKTKLGA